MSVRRAYILHVGSESDFARCDATSSVRCIAKKGKKARVSNRCMYTRSMNNSRMCEFVRILRTRPRICYKHTSRDRFAGFANRTREPSRNKMREANKVRQRRWMHDISVPVDDITHCLRDMTNFLPAYIRNICWKIQETTT